MSKIPTAEEFFNKNAGFLKYVSAQEFAECQILMIEFAKLHVETALKAALEDSPHGSSTDIPSYEDMEFAILNAYPLENIK
jgi:hypothetical protein